MLEDDIIIIKSIRVNNDICYEGFPCKHYVYINNSKTSRIMNGDIIAGLQKKIYKKVDKHFEQYLK
jgi:hypothetical protein